MDQVAIDVLLLRLYARAAEALPVQAATRIMKRPLLTGSRCSKTTCENALHLQSDLPGRV